MQFNGMKGLLCLIDWRGPIALIYIYIYNIYIYIYIYLYIYIYIYRCSVMVCKASMLD